MSYITELRAELDADPATLGYAAIITAAAGDEALANVNLAAEINNTSLRTKNKASLTGSQVLEATDATEFAALADGAKSQWLALCGISSIDPFGAAVSIVQNLFGGGSVTATNLQALRVDSISRAQELGFPTVLEGHIEMARAL